MGSRTLTEKQKAFCEEYLIDLNATQAAIRAGYSEKTAHSIGHENLSKPEIQEYIQGRANDRAERTSITQDRVLEEIAAVAFGDIRSLFNADGSLKPVTELDESSAKLVAGLDVNYTVGSESAGLKTTKIKTNDKLKSLEMLGRHLSLFVDRKQISGPDGGPIEHEHSASEKLKDILGGIAERSAAASKSAAD